MKIRILDKITGLIIYTGLFILGWQVGGIDTSNTTLTQRVARTEQRQLDLITYNDCMACHPQEKRCELINGVVWEWEDGK